MNKQKFLCILFILFFIIFISYSQTEKAPKIFCEEPIYDFGTVPHINIIKHKFVIKNIGDDVLKILDVVATCGCTVTKIKNKNIKPGKKTDILVELDLRGREGKQMKKIIIKSNDPDNKNYELFLKGFTTN